jgi:hypothetical protein
MKKRTAEDLLLEVGRTALTAHLKPGTAALVGVGSLVAITLIEKLSPKVKPLVEQFIRKARLSEIRLPHVPVLPVHPEANAAPVTRFDERQEGRSEVIRAIARGQQN